MRQDVRVRPTPSVAWGSQAALAYVALVMVAGIAVGRGMFPSWAQLVGVVLCIPATVIVAWRASRSGVSWVAWVHDRMNVLFTLAGVLLAVSATVSVYRWASLLAFVEAIGLIGLFTFSREFVSTEWSRRGVARLLFWTGAGVSAVGLVLFAVRGSSVGAVKRLVDALLVVDIVDSKRLAIGFGYSNSFAAFLLLPLAAGLGLVLDASSAWRRAVLGGGLLIMLIAMLESASRGGLLALGFMFVAGSLFIVRSSGGQRSAWKRLGLLYGGLGFAAVVLVIVPPLRQAIVDPVVRRLLSMGSELQSGSALTSGMQGRLTMIRDALRYVRAYPVLGSGAGTYASAYMRFRSTMFFSSDPHSLPFKILAETGVVGLVVGSAIVIAVFRRFWHSVRDATNGGYVGAALCAGSATLLLHACMDWDFAFLAFPILLTVVCGVHAQPVPPYGGTPAKVAPVALAGRHRERVTTEPSRAGSRSVLSFLRRLVRPAVTCWAVVGCVLLTAGLVGLEATRLSSAQPETALGLLDFASAIDPLNADYPYQRAARNAALDALVPAGPDSDRALAIKGDFIRAIELNRYYPLYRINYGRFLLQYRLSDAVQVYEELVRVDPIDPGTFTGLAASYLTIYKNAERAGYWIDEALSVDATYAEAHLVKAMIYEKLGDAVAAAAEYQKASELDLTSPDALVRLATMEKQQGKVRAAARALSEASTRAPHQASIRSALAAIAPVIDISVPQEGDMAGPGQELVLRWEVSGEAAGVEMWSVYLIPAAGEMTPLAVGLNKADRSWKWNIPVTQAPGKYRLIVYARNPSQGADAGGDWLSFGRSGIVIVQSATGH